MRIMSGASKTFVAQAFPRGLDMREWIQTMPDMLHWTLYAKYVNAFLSVPLLTWYH